MNTSTPTKAIKEDPLAVQTDRLSQAVHASDRGRERNWSESLDEALAGVERALRRHMMIAQDPQGVFAEVDETRPTLARQASRLREDHERLLEQCLAIRKELRRPTGEFSFAAADSLPIPGSPKRSNEIIPGHGEIRQHTEKLCDELRVNLQSETHLVLESINTDIGVCD
jgi:hypothetical protein